MPVLNKIDIGNSNLSYLLVTWYQKIQVRRSIVKCPKRNPTASCANYRYIYISSMHQNASLTVHPVSAQ